MIKPTKISCSECMDIIKEFAMNFANKKYRNDLAFTVHIDKVHGNGRAGSGEKYFLNKLSHNKYNEFDCAICKRLIYIDKYIYTRFMTYAKIKLSMHRDYLHNQIYKNFLPKKYTLNQYLEYVANVEIKKIRLGSTRIFR